jgi:hypothetical protein
MIQTILTSQKTNLELSVLLPDDYVGKSLHVLIYKDDEVKDVVLAAARPQKKPSDFAGTLSKEDGAKLLKQIEQSRDEWERDF